MQDQIGEVHSVVRAMKKSASYPMLIKNWKTFSLNLGVNQVYIDDLKIRRNIGTVESNEIPYEILGIWKAANGTTATLKTLYDALVDSGLRDVAESLLTESKQEECVKMVKFRWLNNEITLEELLGKNKSENIYQKMYCLKTASLGQPIQILKEQLIASVNPKCYIPRKLLYKPSNELNPKLFNSNHTEDDIFLFIGISKADLVSLIGYQAVDESGNQLDKVTVKFILLECKNDFERICESTERPVHMIEHKDGSYIWIKSSWNMNLIRRFLKSQGEIIGEEELMSKIMLNSCPCALSIAGSPGMGKTQIIVNLAKTIQLRQPNSIILFIRLMEFAQQLNLIDSSSSALEAIAEYSTGNRSAKLVLLEILSMSETYRPVYLLLDGYDEVKQDKHAHVDSFLKHVKDLLHVKVIVTTRFHLRARLEICFMQFSYEIRPFAEPDRIKFLMQNWANHDKYVAKEGEIIKQFAEQCLITLETKLNDKEKTFAGIPLHCQMLTDMYAKDAQRVSNLNKLSPDAIKAIKSFQVYKKLVEMKLNKIKEPGLKKFYIYEHVVLAIELLFPRWKKAFLLLLDLNRQIVNISENSLYYVGLVEQCSSNVEKIEFVHRTYAEYLLAEYIVKNQRTDGMCAAILFEILGKKGTIEIGNVRNNLKYKHMGPKYPFLSYLIESHMKEYSEHHEISPIHYSTPINPNHVSLTILVCCSNDFEWTFNYATKGVRNYQITSEIGARYFKALPFNVVWLSNSIIMLQKVVEFTTLHFDLCYHTYKDYCLMGLIIPYFTPLHVAVSLGKYNMVTWLIQQYGYEIRTLKFLLHCCVLRSVHDSRSVIDDKLLIINNLVKINRDWLEEKDNEDCTPLLQESVDLRILQRLVEHGANLINDFSSIHGTILHRTWNNESYVDVVHWALSNGFSLFNHKDRYGTTLLMLALSLYENDEDELLKAFHEAGADFKAESCEGDSIIFYPVSKLSGFDNETIPCGCRMYFRVTGSKSVIVNGHYLLQPHAHFNLLKMLVELGADINASSKVHGTILHTTGNQNIFADVVRWSLSNGFNSFDCVDERKRTPLMHAIKRFGSVDDDVLRLFLEAAADFNAQDENGDSVLFYALTHSTSVSFIRKILKHGANVHHINSQQQNAVYKILERIKRNFPVTNPNQITNDLSENHIILHILLRMKRGTGLSEMQGCIDRGADPGTSHLKVEVDADTLLQIMVFSSADIKAYSSKYGIALRAVDEKIDVPQFRLSDEVPGTVAKLHNINFTSVFEETYVNVLRWLLSNGFILFNHTNDYKRTSFLHAIYVHDTLEAEILKLFTLAADGKDFAVQNLNKDYTQTHIRNLAIVDVVKKLLKYESDVNQQEKAVAVIIYSVLDARHKLSLFKFLESKTLDTCNRSHVDSFYDFTTCDASVTEAMLKFLRTRVAQCWLSQYQTGNVVYQLTMPQHKR